MRDPIIPIAEKGLRDYQKLGVRFLITRGAEGCMLADDMGLGKTATAITAARALKSKTLVVCPQYVRGCGGMRPQGEKSRSGGLRGQNKFFSHPGGPPAK